MGNARVEVSAERYDFAVVGAGPAGAVMAILLARAGRSVALIDRDTFPRDKVCGEFLSWDAAPIIELIGVTSRLDAKLCPEITTCRIVSRSVAAEFALPHPARGVSRLLLDSTLVERAAQVGARLFTAHSATSVSRITNGYRIELQPREDAEQVHLHAGAVVGAWGRWGRLDRELGRSFVQTKRRHFGFKRHGIPIDYSRASDVIELHSFKGGYLGVSSVEGGVTNICGLVEESRIRRLKGGWPAFVDQVSAERRPLASLWSGHNYTEPFISSDPVIFAGKESRLGGMTFLGDSSGMIDPLTGNGMAMAMQSAALAFCSLLEREGTGWEREWTEFFAPRIRWSRRAAALLTRPPAVDLGVASGTAARIGAILSSRTRARLDDVTRLAERAARHMDGF